MNGENSLDNINFLPTLPGVFPDIWEIHLARSSPPRMP